MSATNAVLRLEEEESLLNGTENLCKIAIKSVSVKKSLLLHPMKSQHLQQKKWQPMKVQTLVWISEETVVVAVTAVLRKNRSGQSADNPMSKNHSRKANKRHKGVVQKMKRKFHLRCFPPLSPHRPSLFQRLSASIKIKNFWKAFRPEK